MEQEEQIYALMAMVEQKANSLDQLGVDLHSMIDSHTKKVSGLHTEIVQQHTRQIEQYQVKQKELAEQYQFALSQIRKSAEVGLWWKMIIPSVAISTLSVFLIVGGGWSYLQYLLGQIDQASISYGKLVVYNSDIRKCRNGFNNKNEPCVAIKTAGGTFKVGDKTFQIIDPK